VFTKTNTLRLKSKTEKNMSTKKELTINSLNNELNAVIKAMVEIEPTLEELNQLHKYAFTGRIT
jgi:hypothetical protein